MKAMFENLRINLALCSPIAAHREWAKEECLAAIIAAEGEPMAEVTQ